MKCKVIRPVTLQGRDVPAGEIIDVPEKSAKNLAENKFVTLEAVTEATKKPVEPPKVTGDTNVDDNGYNGTGEENASQDTVDVEAIAKAIDDKHKRDELYDIAKDLDIEIPHDIKKADLIAKIIENGVYDNLV